MARILKNGVEYGVGGQTLTDRITAYTNGIANDLKNALTAKLIWTNAATSAEFTGQTIILSGNYDAVLVVYRTWYSSAPVSVRTVFNNNTLTELNVTDTKISYRRCKLNGRSLTFESGNNVGPYGSQSTANGVVVPTHVYGLSLKRG